MKLLSRLLACLALLSLASQPLASAPYKPAIVNTNGSVGRLPVGGTVQTNPSATGGAAINIPPGTAPSAPVNGDCWTTSAGVFCRINGATVQLGGDTPTGTVSLVEVTTANGVSATVDTPDTTPNLTFSLGAITPTSVVASGSVTGSNLSGTNTGDQNLSSYATTAAVAAGYQPLDSDLTSIAGLTTTSHGRGLLDDADAAAGRTSLGVVIGTNVQAYDADLTTYAGITPSADVQSLLAAANDAAFRTDLGLGSLATQSGTFSGTSSGTNTGDQTSIVGITGTKAQFDTAVTDGNFLYSGDVTQYTDEMARDALGTAIVAGTGVVVTPNDGADTITVAQSPSILFQSYVPFVIPSSASIANNCVITGMAAMASAYPQAYLYLPANAIAAGSAAGWYYAVFSSTTAATCYNNVYDPAVGGVPPIPGSPTAFATTGPGAYTQDVSAGRKAMAFTLPAGTLTSTSRIVFDFAIRNSASANAKSVAVRVGGGAVATTNTAGAGNGGTNVSGWIIWAGSDTKQIIGSSPSSGGSAVQQIDWFYSGSLNFANALVIDLFPNLGNAAETIVIPHFVVRVER